MSKQPTTEGMPLFDTEYKQLFNYCHERDGQVLANFPDRFRYPTPEEFASYPNLDEKPNGTHHNQFGPWM